LEIKNLFVLAVMAIMLSLSSCYTENKPDFKAPPNLFTKDKMVAVMTDVQLAESAINHERLHQRKKGGFKELYYNQIFIEHNITAKDFKDNLNYYNTQPKLMEEILDKVLENINKIMGETEIIIAEKKIADSLKRQEPIEDKLMGED